MGAKSIKKRSNTIRSIPKSQSPMPSPSKFTLKKFPLFVLFFMALSIIALLGISPIMLASLGFANQSPNIYTIQVVNEFPHDPTAFTQGLLYAGNDTLFESTGLYGESSVRQIDLRSGKVEVIQNMDASYFGEGLTLLGERLFQVTWLTKTGFIYDRNNLREIKKFTHEMSDGWGLATDGKVLFGSDGTSALYQLDPQTLKTSKINIVKYGDQDVRYLNELEFVNGEIWANVWGTDCIAKISGKDGSVIGWILLENLRKGLIAAGYRGVDVLNGIAWDSNDNRLFVTGKLWPKLYEIKLQPVNKHMDSRKIKQLCIP
ncbi:glutaminyl-peptide cyclotransferase [Mercurialis annua]|uniref:glutaminyl-peptide cyclotransferase n=1 Tax=Mercurialis annua TaxID=3986 RepID=UPI00215F1BAF|nr:glutaminyl-peptide cyclotransferase [Mercurialis annua]